MQLPNEPAITFDQYRELQRRMLDGEKDAMVALSISQSISYVHMTLKVVRGEYPAALDADGELRPDWLQIIAGPLEDETQKE